MGRHENDTRAGSAGPDSQLDPRPDPRPDPMTPDGRDRLISRIIDAEATGADWDSFRRLAASDASVWRELCEGQDQHEALCDALREAAGVADGVDLPFGAGGGLGAFEHRLDGVRRWGGWAAAAALVLAWGLGGPWGVPGAGSLQTGSLGPRLADATAQEALNRYLAAGQDSGRVVGEVPDRVIVDTTPRPDGSIEVLYLRQIVERRVSDRVWRESHDEVGRMVPVAMPASEIQRRRAF